VSQERRGVSAFSLDVRHRGALDRHPAGCEDYSGADPGGALLRPAEQASADRVNRETEHLKPRRERPGSRDKGESE
jgi:hypothetical protein